MADNRLVHNTAAYPLVVADDGTRVLGNSSREIDISQPRAKNFLSSGNLILVNTPQEETAQPRGSAKQKNSSEPKTTNGE